ncbi:hypothetical protein [Serratia fonticola]|uniref:hypothetical protein n=1 Tax=Serratia fonticola TaxID=47917 RepID=UPI00301B96B8
MSKPTDEQILSSISKYGGKTAMTYVVANVLRMDGFNGLNTSFVLRRLKHMESQGLVKRVPGFYAKQYCWEKCREGDA